MNLEKEISGVIEQKLNDGTLEKIVGEQFEKCIKSTAENLLGTYGDIGGLIKEKIKQAMIPAIERTDFTEYLTKLDVVLAEIVDKTSLQENKKILDNFKELMCEEEIKTIKFSDIFERYCKYVANRIDTSNLDVIYEDEATYETVRATATFEDETSPYSEYQRGRLIFSCEEDEDLNFEVEVSRWPKFDKAEHWTLRTLGAVDIKSLRYMDEFEVFIQRLHRLGCNVVIDGTDLEDFVQPEKTPELTYR